MNKMRVKTSTDSSHFASSNLQISTNQFVGLHVFVDVFISEVSDVLKSNLLFIFHSINKKSLAAVERQQIMLKKKH